MELLKVFLMSAVPIVEQRGAIPMGIFMYNINPVLVCIVSFLGSLLPVPFILLLFNSIFKWMKKYKIFDPLNNIIENKIRKNTGKLEKYKEIGLIIFVGIPLPTTGLWTGSAVTAFMGLDFKKSFLCAVVGGLISAIVITAACIIFPAFIPH
ncbi:COG2426 family protein [Clostridium tetani]|uniref:Ligand-binding protein SH3 n=1 Tax=Clostridium tetani TaxID=1513 RepID=A0ABY0EVC3_CLOTA|nr:small multi-drug export protein [Clostridium tetani]KHO32244.1 ligand-binding protein SH3 [Clostridium tetani]RXI57760.1 ligand-binding protein SH3 [Clostridium tetani]RXI67688.1 ligand-binding protein SH3 [Clostridium tetani]CDI50725.1 small multi-drug export protein [Clostridium tetani 12124569]